MPFKIGGLNSGLRWTITRAQANESPGLGPKAQAQTN